MYPQHALNKCLDQHDLHSGGLVDLLKKEQDHRKATYELFNQFKVRVNTMVLHNKEFERTININIDEERKRKIEIDDSKVSLGLIRDLVEKNAEEMVDGSTMSEIEKVLSFYYKCDRVSLKEYKINRIKQQSINKEKPSESCQNKRKDPPSVNDNEEEEAQNKKQKQF